MQRIEIVLQLSAQLLSLLDVLAGVYEVFHVQF
jgi:hypothetical protein